jgi:hypothetical protein
MQPSCGVQRPCIYKIDQPIGEIHFNILTPIKNSGIKEGPSYNDPFFYEFD